MSRTLQYQRIIATGGIGTGMFFQLVGNNTLSRDESRMAKLLPYKDYCKQHIILHYISSLLGAGKNEFESIAIGKVGSDDAGKNLIQQMKEVGINTSHVTISDEDATLFSVCYLYPDHAGGNITTAESASSKVLPADIDDFFSNFNASGKTLVLAAPEVPVTTRIRLLEHGRKHQCINIASVTSSEIHDFISMKGFEFTDFLFINLDEARSVAGSAESSSTETIVLAAIRTIIKHNNNIAVFVTCGAEGVYCYQQKRFEFSPAKKVEVVSTAGAGDAFLAGTVAGIAYGFPLFKLKDPKVVTAIDIGIAVASEAVTSPHTIHPDITSEFIKPFLHDAD